MPCHSDAQFITVATSGGVEISADAKGPVSFFNSPYFSHECASAIDVYSQPCKDDALSPVDGILIEKRMVHTPYPRHFQCSGLEHLLIIQSSQRRDLFVRILHANSSLEVGDRVRVGEFIGKLVRSGFFDFWTEKHLHVEVRGLGNLVRAKGSLTIAPNLPDGEVEGEALVRCPYLRVVRCFRDYVLAEALEGTVSLGLFLGFGCSVRGKVGLLDGGIPHYGFGGVVFSRGEKVEAGDPVTLWGMMVGRVSAVYDGMAVFRSYPLSVELDGHRLHGLSFYLWQRPPLLKLIPKMPMESYTLFQEGDKLEVSLRRIH
ncbi:MAG: hypothetical protein QXF26_09130 [Candidatus Bathyarchaeia archaeon]